MHGKPDAVLTVQLWYRAAGSALLKDDDDIAVGKAGRFHVEISVKSKILLLDMLFLRGLSQDTVDKKALG